VTRVGAAAGAEARATQANPLAGRERSQKLGVIAPPFLFLVALYVVPAALLLMLSLWHLDNNYELKPGASIEQYRRIFSDPIVIHLLARTFLLAAETTAITLLIGFPLAYYLAKVATPRWRNLLMVALIAPSWTSHLIRIYAWMLVLGNDGLINFAAKDAHVPGAPFEFLLFNRGSVLIALVYVYLPYMVVPVYASLDKIDDKQLEAASSLGASSRRVLLRVILPLCRTGIVAGCMLTFIPTLGEYVAPAILGGRSGYMYGNYVSDRFASFDWPAGAALGIVLLATTVGLLFALSRLANLRGERRPTT
jgi:spermidine/putrescine transport system permease protein